MKASKNLLKFVIINCLIFLWFLLSYVQFSSVQSLSCVWLFATPWTTARQASLSITNCQSLLKPIELVMSSNHLILCHPLLLLPSIFPSIRVFSNESALRIRWPKYWSFYHKGGINCISEFIDTSSGNLDSSLCFIQPGISHDVLCVKGKQAGWQYKALMCYFPNLEPVCCSMSSSNYCFLTYIQISQEAGHVVW